MSTKSGIPSWQRTQATTPPTVTDEQLSEPEEQPETPSATRVEESTVEDSHAERTTSLEQASKFLEHPTIRDAPREKKVAFLQSKGVEAEDIETLLESVKQEHASSDLSEEAERAWSTAPQAPKQSPAPKPQAREVAPIVTYPEFLTPSTKPPPLITTQRLLNTAYIAGGLAATMYGLSKYIIAPMTQNLLESRHDFASHAKEKLDEFNTRLADVVSTDPANMPKSKNSEIVDDVSEADSDPTELFHRDFGTQTSPSLSRRPSTASSPDADTSAVTGHENRLRILKSHLQELEATRSNDKASSDSLQTTLSDLTAHLSEISYQNQYYSGMGGMYGGTYGLPKSKDGKDDYIEALKSDIRAVKGVLLSARNFPAGGPRAAGRVSG